MTTYQCEFLVQGEPVGQPRARHGRGRTYSAKGAIDQWRNRIDYTARQYRPRPPLEGPVQVDLVFRFSRPRSHYRKDGSLKPDVPEWHVVKPDRDNLDKAVLDTLKELGFFLKDDCQVCAGIILKKYADAYDPAGVSISIRQL